MVENLRFIIKSSIIIGLVIDLICYKYRNLANCLLYWESALILVYYLVPSPDYVNSSPIFFAVTHSIYFSLFYTGPGSQLIFQVVTLAVIYYFILPIAYD